MGALDGKVAIVTGAGRGLGRAEALELARQGARVVVNDFGVALDGVQAADADQPAHQVVEEITAAGGEAVAHLGDVADWDQSKALIRLAVDTFGNLNVLVNNAGILRDRMVFNMDIEEWDAVIRVHMRGHFCTSRWATEYWRERSKETGGTVDASIVNTSSEAFLFGSPGQPNYAAAKGGIIGLTMATATSMAKYGVRANAIAPRAATRMTEMFGLDQEEFDPAHVATFVAYLGSPASERVSGQLFVVYGGLVGVVAQQAFDQRFESPEGRWTVEGLTEALGPYFDKRQPVQDGYTMPMS
ncbi:MAG TPA: SDR family NAD(P)-dependent oxidoreductase [Actinomycetota bacterium]|nr:SDR family NAD(P)-dependent oxidoreductase [Actinomycetota bacterium]